MRRNKSKSFAHLPPSPATHTISSTLRLKQPPMVDADASQRSPGFIRALNSQRSEHARDHQRTPSRPKSSHSRPGTPPSKGFMTDEKRKNRSSVGSRFAAEAKHFFQGAGQAAPSLNSRRKSTPAIKTASISSTSNESPSTSRDSTSFSSLKSRRNSASSEISSIQSHNDEFGFNKDVDVPPVPRIPKDYSTIDGIGGLNALNNLNTLNTLDNGLHSQASASSQTTAVSPPKSDRTAYKKESHSSMSSSKSRPKMESRDSNYSPTQANCINFPQSSTKRQSTVRRMTPSSIPFFRRSASAQNINGHAALDETPPPVPPISQTHMTHNSVSSAGTNGTTGSSSSATTTPSHRKSMLGLGFPSLLRPSSSRKSLSSSKPISSDNLSDKHTKQGSEQSTFRQRRNSLSAAIMGRRRGKSVGSGSGPADLPSEPVPKIKSEFLDKKEEKEKSATPHASPATRTRTVRASMHDTNDKNTATLQSTNSPSYRTFPHSSTLQQSNSQSSYETLHPDGKRDQKLVTPTRIPRISMSAVRAPGAAGAQTQPQTRSPSSITRKASLTDTARKVSDTSVHTVNSVSTVNSKSRMSTSGSMSHMSDAVNASTDSNREMRKRVVDKSLLESQSRRLSKMAIDNNVNATTKEEQNKTDRNNTISLVKTPRQSSTYSKANTSIPTSVSSSSIASRNGNGVNTTPKIRSVAPAVSSRSSTGLAHANSATPLTAKVRPPRNNEDEVVADEEMMAYIRRSQARKLAAGAKLSELESMLAFPEDVHPTPRMSPREAVALYGSSLSPYEQNEINSFRDVYFVGQSSKKRPATKERSSSNHGYDDDRGDYLVIKHDHLNYRYEIMDTLGKGSFGQVLECLDHKTGKSVAIKIIRNKKRFHHQALVEVKILDRLVDWVGCEGMFICSNTAQ